jgi:hypothetical protein
MTYACTLFNWDYTLGEETTEVGRWLLSVLPVATIVVQARNRREAAARAYVRCVGSKRAKFLREALQAPPAVVKHEMSPRAIAPALARMPGGSGHCYCLDNMVEAWLITAEPLSSVPVGPPTHPSGLSSSPRRHRLRTSLPSPSVN